MGPTWPTYNDLFLTLLRWGLGLSCGTVIGVFGALAESSLIAKFQVKSGFIKWGLSGLLDFARALPVIALVPVVQTLGVDEWWKIGLIAWAALFPIWLSVRQAQARRMIDTELALAACGLSRKRLFWVYPFPKVLGGLMSGVEISIGVAWISVVAAEWVGTFTSGFWAGGLGYRVVRAHDANNWIGMIMCLLLFGTLGVATSWLWRKTTSANSWLFSVGFNPTFRNGE